MRLIDADTIFNGKVLMVREAAYDAVHAVIEKINNAPTVDAEPVRHGRWTKNGDRYCECSVCHHEGNMSGHDNYCRNCGAKMDGERREDATSD